MGNLEDIFNKDIREWKVYCEKVKFSSNPQDYIDCDAYQNLVKMGPRILPLIRDLYNKPQESLSKLRLSCLVQEIVQDSFQIPKSIQGRVQAINNYTQIWLDENMHRYI